MTSEPAVGPTAATGAGPDGGAPGRRARLLSLLRLGKGGAGRHVATLSLGTGLVMALTLVTQFVVGRLLPPDDFGAYRNVVALATIAALGVTLSLERAISLADTEEEAADLTRLTLVISAVFSIVVAPVTLWMAVAGVGGTAAYRWSLFAAPLLLWSTAAFNVLRYYLPRHELFKDVSSSNTIGTAAMGVVQVGSALARWVPGLPMGYLIGRFASVGLMLRACQLPLRRRVDWSLVRKWRQFPTWMMLPALLNAITVGGVTPLISALYGDHFSGNFAFTQQLLAAPVALLGSAVASVFYVRFATIDRAGTDASRPMVQLASILLAIGVAIFVPVTLFGREIIVVLVPKYELAGVICGLMAPYLMMQFASSPLAGYATVKNRVKRNFVLGFIEAGIRVPALAVGVLVGEPMWGIQAYCWAGLAITLYWVVWVMRLSGASARTAWGVVALPLLASTMAWALTTFGRDLLGETAYVLVALVFSAAALAWGGLATLKALRGR